MYQIDDNIPIPIHKFDKTKTTVLKLEVGQSFFVTDYTTSNVRTLLRDMKRRDESFTREFVTRKVKENNLWGTRVWRTA